MPPEPEEKSDLEELAEAAWSFAESQQERDAYLEALREQGASEDYIAAVEAYWEARDDLKDIPGDLWDRFTDWVRDLFGKNDGRSG